MEVGDAVVYPHYGAGTIKEIKEIERGEETQKYLVIEIYLNQQTVKIPEENMDQVGVRQLTPKDEFYEHLEEVEEFIRENYDPEEGTHPEKIHQQTLKALLSDIREGDLEAAMEGLKKLQTRFLDQELNITEKRVYDTVHQFLKGELMCLENWELDKAEEEFNEYLPQSLAELEPDEDQGENGEEE